METPTNRLYIAGGVLLAVMCALLWLTMRPAPQAAAPAAASTPNARQVYAGAVGSALAAYESDLADLTRLLAQYQRDPGAALDPDLAASLRSVTRRLEATGAGLRQLDPPDALLPLHREVLQIEQEISNAAQAAPDRRAVEHIDAAAGHMETLAAMLQSRDWGAMPTSRPAGAPTAEDRPRTIGVRVTVTPTLGAVLGRDTNDPVFPTPTP